MFVTTPPPPPFERTKCLQQRLPNRRLSTPSSSAMERRTGTMWWHCPSKLVAYSVHTGVKRWNPFLKMVGGRQPTNSSPKSRSTPVAKATSELHAPIQLHLPSTTESPSAISSAETRMCPVKRKRGAEAARSAPTEVAVRTSPFRSVVGRSLPSLLTSAHTNRATHPTSMSVDDMWEMTSIADEPSLEGQGPKRTKLSHTNVSKQQRVSCQKSPQEPNPPMCAHLVLQYR